MGVNAVRSRGVTRRRLETQGLADLADGDIAAWGRWVQFPYALCAAIVASGTLLASAAILWALIALAAAAAASRVHPFDPLYNGWLRRYTRTPRLPLRAAPTRFACGVGAAWLLAAGLAFALGAPVVGYAMGATMVAIQVLVATTHICVMSLVYRLLFGLARTRAPACSSSRLAPSSPGDNSPRREN